MSGAPPPRAPRRTARTLPLLAVLVVLAGCAAVDSAASSPHRRPSSLSNVVDPSASGRTATATPPACSNARVLTTWPLARRAAQLVVVPAEETDVAAVAPIVQLGIGGIILYGPTAPPDLAGQLASVEAGAPPPVAPLVMTDEEGGDVQRMADLAGPLPSAATMAQTMTAAQVRALAQQTAERMRAAGVTMDVAPVLDLASGAGPDGARAFSPQAAVVTEYGLAFAQGLEAGGVIPVVKHFPGEGSASADTDVAPAATPPLSTLLQADLLPFEAAIDSGLPAVMVGNASVPGLSSAPASLSPSVITGLLRRQLGFHGLVLTDALSATAISATGLTVPEASVKALEAGADMVVFDSATPDTDTRAVVVAIEAAVSSGALPPRQLDQSVGRVLDAKGVDLCRRTLTGPGR